MTIIAIVAAVAVIGAVAFYALGHAHGSAASHSVTVVTPAAGGSQPTPSPVPPAKA